MATSCTTRTMRSGTAAATMGEGAGDEQEGTESDESKDTGSVAKPKLRILPKTPETSIM